MAILIIDFDGTIHDSMCIYAPAVRFCHQKLLKEGVLADREITDEQIRRYLGLTAAQMWKQFAPELSGEQHQRGSQIIYEEMYRLTQAGCARLYDGALAVLRELKTAGHRLIFLSNCQEGYMKQHTRTFGLDQYFDEMYCSGQFDWAEKPQIVRQLIPAWKEILQSGPSDGHFQRPGIIVIGDRYKDMEIVQAADSGQAQIRTVFCAYGFGEPQEGQYADEVALKVRDIPGCVRNLAQILAVNR